ncbi:uncharacterized protein BJX67DRAFT_46479 [Aspergillus lucknowensis]|uniref:Uncharacterized protein n=1 Tax=Aspergillus lucknowensis TaxID=176173 RepID=A0ABR4LVR0_9EURO
MIYFIALMPTSKTPVHAPRQNVRSQFASTPRFVLSQRAVGQPKRAGDSDSILSEEDAEPFPVRVTQTAAPVQTSSRKDVIEDPRSELDHEWGRYEAPADETRAENIPSSPPVDVAELDAELEALFGPTKPRAKRRRISLHQATPVSQARKPRDLIESSPPEPRFPEAEPPSPSLPYRTTPSRAPRHPATPVTAKQTTRNLPRFLVPSPSYPPSSTQSQQPFRPLAATPGPTTRKPVFVLPRSPSPEQDDQNDIPTPFSPSSHALRGRGRQRSSAPSYLPGGMAAEVRSWILEMGTKREQQLLAVRDNRNGAGPSSVDLQQKYSLVVRISNVRQHALGSCGLLAFVRGQDEPSLEHMESGDGEDAPQKTRNALLLGPPRLRPGELRTSAHVPSLQAGNVVGVFRGLVWEVDSELDSGVAPEYERALQHESARCPGLGRWLVGMEWEVISSSD